MNLETIEKHFCSYLDKYWKLSDITPILHVYIRLLLLFKSELSEVELDIILSRQKRLRGGDSADYGFEELINSSRSKMNEYLKNNTSTKREAMLNRLLLCALLNAEENDFFYLTEPMFEFVREMQVSPDLLAQILKSEFIGFKI
jgi:hypothetical protein